MAVVPAGRRADCQIWAEMLPDVDVIGLDAGSLLDEMSAPLMDSTEPRRLSGYRRVVWHGATVALVFSELLFTKVGPLSMAIMA